MPEDWISKFFDEPTTPSDQNIKKKATSESSSQAFINDEELESQFKTFQNYYDQTAKQVDESYSKLGINKQKVADYLSDPNNFNPEQWQMIQQKRKEMQDQLWKLLGIERKKEVSRKEKEKTEQKRKGKTLGARKKWMPMR